MGKEILINLGDRFNRWRVVDYAEKKNVGKANSQRIFLLCECDCGVRKKVRKDYLLKGSSQSCGCLRRELAVKKGKDQRTETGYLKWKTGNMRRTSRNRHIDFHLSENEVKYFITKNCYYCGVEPKFHDGKTHFVVGIRFPINGIDRIDSNKGYEKDNCVPCCWKCNTMKMALDQSDFLDHIRKIHNNIRLGIKE